MDLPAEMFVKAVPGHDDLIAFRYDFALEGKAVDGVPAQTVTELDDGDLLIEGYAAVFDGLDRQNENFDDGAFQRGIKSFLGNQASLNFHHKHDLGIGKVLDLEEKPGKGLWMRARVDHQPESSPLRYIYNGVKKGTYNALSVGGFFKRALREGGRKIVDCDFTEISVTPVPVHPGTNFAVVAGKALEDAEPASEEVPTTEFPEGLDDIFARFNGVFDSVKQVSEKALPANHDPKDARFVAGLLACVARAREIAGIGSDDANDEGVIALANEVETQGAKWEAQAHKLAAKIGPLPAPPSY